MDRKAGDSDVNDGSQSASDSEFPRSALQITARSSPNNLPPVNTDRTSSARSSDIGEPQSQESKTSIPLCEVCRSMFSTLDGPKALVSKNGYEYARIGYYNSSGWEDPSKDPKNKLIARGLVLMEVGDGLFERVGVFKERVDGPQGMRDVFDESGTSEWKILTIM
jgi:hypothetical protein